MSENENDLVGEFLCIVAGAFKRSAGEVRTSDEAGHRVRLSWKDDGGTHEEVIEGLTVGAICADPRVACSSDGGTGVVKPGDIVLPGGAKGVQFVIRDGQLRSL